MSQNTARQPLVLLVALLGTACCGKGFVELEENSPSGDAIRPDIVCAVDPDPAVVDVPFTVSVENLNSGWLMLINISDAGGMSSHEMRADSRGEIAMGALSTQMGPASIEVFRRLGKPPYRDQPATSCTFEVVDQAPCGDGVCGADEDCSECPDDCGPCPTFCGDGVCDADEDCSECADDCGTCPTFCGDGVCDADEDCSECADDCGPCPTFCGDGTCDADEDCSECADDCGTCPTSCGDGVCDGNESCTSCATDCGSCPGGVYRAFTDESYWNTPMPAAAPIDENSDLYIADASDPSVSWPPYVRLSGAPDHSGGYDWAYPIYWADPSDPVYTVSPSRYGGDITARIPIGATPQGGSDGGIVVYDIEGNQVIELWQAEYDSTRDQWSAASTKIWVLDSNGLHRGVAGSDSDVNDGHRGVPTPIRAVRMDEVQAGTIAHRLECFWHATGRPDDSTPWNYWPLAGYESGKGGIVPEGLVLRIKPSVDLESKGLSRAALVIARAMQDYGCVIGDNEGGTKNSIKLERDKLGADCEAAPCTWAEVDADISLASLEVLSWDEYEFVQGGFDPR